MPTFSLATSLKNKLGGGSGRGGSPQAAGGSSPQPRVSFVDSADPNAAPESTGKLPQQDLDAELRASPACQRKSAAAGEHELEADEEPPSLDSVFARRTRLLQVPTPYRYSSSPCSSGRSSPPPRPAQGWGWDTGTQPLPRVLKHAADPLPLCTTTPLYLHPGWTTPHQRLCTLPWTCIGLRC